MSLAKTHKEWEKPLVDLEDTIRRLKEVAVKESDPVKRARYEGEAAKTEEARDKYIRLMYANLGDWEKVRVARAEKRPYTLDTFRRSSTISSSFRATEKGLRIRRLLAAWPRSTTDPS